MSKYSVIELPLKEWMDPQENPLLLQSDNCTLVYFSCWTDQSEEANYCGKLTFSRCWASRVLNVEIVPYLYQHKHRSSILCIENSEWLSEVSEYRQKIYPRWKTWDDAIYQHYVIQGHDRYIELIAAGYEESVCPLLEITQLKQMC